MFSTAAEVRATADTRRQSLPVCGTCNPSHAKQLRADGASRGASRHVADVKPQVGGGEMKLGRLDSNQDYQGQNLACCQLHYGPIPKTTVSGVYAGSVSMSGASANILRGSISQ